MPKAYLIDPERQVVEPFEYTHGAGFGAHLPGGLCLGWHYSNGDVLYVDDEGLLRPARAGFRVMSRTDGQPMMSKGVLCGPEISHADGSYHIESPRMPLDRAQREFQFLTLEEALAWFRAKSAEPAVQVSGTTARGTVRRQTLATWGDLLANLQGKPGGYQPPQ